jgi:uncharacterized protein (DUF1778 family)
MKDLFIGFEKKTESVLIRMTYTQKKVLKQMCKERGLTITQFILELIQHQYDIFRTCEHLYDDDLPY